LELIELDAAILFILR